MSGRHSVTAPRTRTPDLTSEVRLSLGVNVSLKVQVQARVRMGLDFEAVLLGLQAQTGIPLGAPSGAPKWLRNY